ncbi:MAG: hypothetical protein U1E40_12630 [Amaricoccus sp.]
MPKLRRSSFALAIVLAAAGAAGAETPAPPAPEAPPPVAQTAPKGSSGGDMAMGAAVGLVGGLLVLALIVGSGG